MLDHTLEVACYAVKLRQSYLLPLNESTEEQAKQAEAWTAAIFIAAALHDVGKLLDFEVQDSGKIWQPWHDKTLSVNCEFSYRKNRDYHLHPKLGLLFATKIIPVTLLDWLVNYTELYQQLLYFLSGEMDRAGVLAEIIQKADAASVSQNLGGDTALAMAKPVQSFDRQLLIALRYLLQEQYKLNNATSGSDGWLTQDSLWLMSKTLADDIRTYLLKNGINGTPTSNSKLYDELQAHQLIISNGDKAIWNCRVELNNGKSWEFTLLKINPTLIWPNINDRPAAFSGKVIVNEAKVEQVNKIAASELNISTQEPNNIHDAGTSDDTTNLVFDLFAPIMNESLPAKNLSKQTDNTINIIESTEEESETIPANISDNLISTDPQESDFIQWINLALRNDTLEINTAKAVLHTINDTVLLVTPGIFKKYALLQLNKNDDEAWRQVQNEFQKLKIHQKHGKERFNIIQVSVQGPRKKSTIKGYLLKDPNVILRGDTLPNNPYLSIDN